MVFSKEATQPPPAKRQRLGAVALDSEGRTLSEYRQQAKDTNAAHNHGVKYSFLNNIRDQKGRKPEDKEYDARKLHVPESCLGAMTNFERQYWEIKMANWDTVLFFKKGKFYELYERDADIGHQEFDLKMVDTARSSMRMVGLPEQTFGMWASRFIGAGYKVGRVEQMQTRTQLDRIAKGGKAPPIVPRELCQILTLATLTELDMITDHEAKYIVAVKEDEGAYGIVVADTSRGEFRFAHFREDEQRVDFVTMLHTAKPKELILERNKVSKVTLACIDKELGGNVRKSFLTSGSEFIDMTKAREHLEASEFFPINPPPEGLAAYWDNSLVMSAFGAMCTYLNTAKLDTELLSMKNFGTYDPYRGGNALVLDGTTLANLEILESASGRGSQGTLLQHVSHCVSPMGRRMLHEWICAPLLDAAAIRTRQDAVAELVEQQGKQRELRDFLRRLPDLERNLSRLGVAGREREVAWVDPSAYNKKIVNIFVATLQAFRTIYTFIEACADDPFASQLLKDLTLFKDKGGSIADYGTELTHFQNSFDFSEAQATGSVVPNKGQNKKYDETQETLRCIEGDLDELLLDVKKHYGTQGSKVKFVDFGKDKRLVQVPTSAVADHKACKGLEVKSSNQTVTRFVFTEAKALIEQHDAASDELEGIKRGVLKHILCRFSDEAGLWKSITRKLSYADCLCSLAQASSLPGMCRPVIKERLHGEKPFLKALKVVHPLVRPAVCAHSDNIIANDILLGGDEPPVALITGPNMGGKSTVMRSACVVIIFSQLGCFVPAESVEMTPVDRIFTRIGAMDRILSGLSTFMVEMRETSAILKSATQDSFIVLDELGRGTATVDGYSIAHAVMNDIAHRIACRTMFSTHYHFLCRDVLAMQNDLISMYRMAYNIDPVTRSVTFLYKYVRGATNESYGVDVAKKADISEHILKRSQDKSNEFRLANDYEDDDIALKVAVFARNALRSKDASSLRCAKRKACDMVNMS